ncbi:hypothetical protein SAMN02910298_02930 [Pseudobutyrivibrio sp. YE44]|uniref:hypothetical protein n=1 Tax=Pseudobutyrivibrio sp. YE44 TaxID=1520802 RepID=UPI00088B33E5|nr:hypothetical protein [Pseudobutyrivibrio sp. YE44]SDB56835.1 hypothetical protein SAMN02910298_02930 [Pseudobutyrivibrio sp. YE44]
MEKQNGKFFDVSKTREYFGKLSDQYTDFASAAGVHKDSIWDMINTNSWRGTDAETAKNLLKTNKITLVDALTDLHMETLEIGQLILDKFAAEVDDALDARIDYDTLEKINLDYKNLYANSTSVFDSSVEQATSCQQRFSRYGDIRIPDYSVTKDALIDICGGDDDEGGFIFACMKKLEKFDAETLAMIEEAEIEKKADILFCRMHGKSAPSKLNFKLGKGFDLLTALHCRPWAINALFNGKGFRTRYGQGDIMFPSMWRFRNGGRGGYGSKFTTLAYTTKTKKSNKSTNAPAKPKKTNSLQDVANDLDKQMALLCDDNNANDEQAIAKINEDLKVFITTEKIDGDTYVVYDQAKIQKVMSYVEKDNLAYQLLYSLNAQIEENRTNGDSIPEKIGKLSWNASADDTYLEVEKYGAGVVLKLTSDYNFWPLNEKDGEIVAYAATEESAKNYFMNNKGDHWGYDWDAIIDWCTDEEMICNGVEIDFMAKKLAKMSDENAFKFIEKAETVKDDSLVNDILFKVNTTIYTDHVRLVVAESEMLASKKQDTKDNRDKYTRAILFSNVVDKVTEIDLDCNPKFGKPEDTPLGKIYSVTLDNYYDNIGTTMKVYPLAEPINIDDFLDRELLEITRPELGASIQSVANGCATNFISETITDGCIWTIQDEIINYYSAVQLHASCEEMIDIANDASKYGVKGRIMTENYAGTTSANILVDSIDMDTIKAATIYYNNNIDPDITEDKLIYSYYHGGTIRDNYLSIYNQEEIYKIKKEL